MRRCTQVEVAFLHGKGARRGRWRRISAAHPLWGGPHAELRSGAARSANRAPRPRLPCADQALSHHRACRAQGRVVGGCARRVCPADGAGHCTLESVLGVRACRRAAAAPAAGQGLSFRDLVDEWRRSRALALVANTRLPLSEVSEALGYSEQSVFTRRSAAGAAARRSAPLAKRRSRGALQLSRSL